MGYLKNSSTKDLRSPGNTMMMKTSIQKGKLEGSNELNCDFLSVNQKPSK